MHAVAMVGPLAINVQANVWSKYESGVFDGCSNLTNIDIDHVVQMVGYGTDPSGGDYWLVRNSWNTVW
jgi:cathepsin L